MERIKIRKLFKNISLQAIHGSKDVEISGITSNSKLVAPGNLFIAKKGLNFNGADFIQDAIAAGAAALLTDLYDPFYSNITQIIHPNVASIEAEIAKEFYSYSGDPLFLVGITGTNGKTTTSYLIHHLLTRKEKLCGLIGTIEWIVGPHVFPSIQTTPDVLQNFKLFHDMAGVGCHAAVMEVSSHALTQGRVQSIPFDIAVFTNLTQDHLDYHKTMQEYANAKANLFTDLKESSIAIVNSDSPYSSQMTAGCRANIIYYGIDQPCDLMASSLQLTSSGMEFDVAFRGKQQHFTSLLIGRYNVYNILASIGVALGYGYSLEETAEFLKDFAGVPGRLERVPNKRGLNIFVDYAHTDDALSNVLQTLQEFKQGRLITVFGCGGDRDPLKRPKMGAVAETHSDFAIVTSDNPRSEDPEAIIRSVLTGFKKPGHAFVMADREQAIHHAVQIAKPEDIVLIAGKGHETYQIFSKQTIHFDDRVIAKAACDILQSASNLDLDQRESSRGSSVANGFILIT